MKNQTNNPYLISYLSLALICCLAISTLFMYINSMNLKREQDYYNQKKVELLADDLDVQLQLFEKIATKIKITDVYQPFYFSQNKYYEILLLDDLKRYATYSPLAAQYFLHYCGHSNLFLSSGNTINLNIYTKNFSQDESESFLQALSGRGDPFVMMVGKTIYWLIPIEIVDSTGRTNAILGFAVEQNTLGERFQFVSRGMEGSIFLTKEDELLYSNQETPYTGKNKNVLTASTLNGDYRIYYLPAETGIMLGGFLPLQLLLMVAALLLVSMLAILYARKSYRPIVEITEKYRSKVPYTDEVKCENALEEINYLIDSMLQNNMLANVQLNQKQELLRGQLLQMLLDGKYTFDIQPYLEKMQVNLPGPYYYVISILFDEKEIPANEFLTEVQEELRQLSTDAEREYLYTVCNYEKKSIFLICSIKEPGREDELTEYVCEIVKSHEYEPIFGVGNVYKALSRISASWLESMDNIYNNVAQKEVANRQAEEGYSIEKLQRFFGLLQKGDEAGAWEEFMRVMHPLEAQRASFLMQQYFFANFLTEFTRIAKKKEIALSNANISLMISARNIKDFEGGVKDLIHELCGKINDLKEQEEKEGFYEIFEYVNAHYTDYDLSIEKIADEKHTTVTMVRQAIQKYTGKMYKDYLIFLRIEQAKKLLLTEPDLMVLDVCQRVGYTNISYFIKLFKEMTGVTPSKYRANPD